MDVNDSTEKNVQRHTVMFIENNHHSCLNVIYPINMNDKEITKYFGYETAS